MNVSWPYGPMGSSDFDACAHVWVPDAGDHHISFCTTCGECRGNPDPTPRPPLDTTDPFGHPVVDRHCPLRQVACTTTTSCAITCAWEAA